MFFNLTLLKTSNYSTIIIKRMAITICTKHILISILKVIHQVARKDVIHS